METMGVWLGKQVLGQRDEIGIQTNLQIAILGPAISIEPATEDRVVQIEAAR